MGVNVKTLGGISLKKALKVLSQMREKVKRVVQGVNLLRKVNKNL